MTQLNFIRSYNGLDIPKEGPYSDETLYQIDMQMRCKMVDDAMGYYRTPGRFYHAQPHPIRMLNNHVDYWHSHPTDALFLSILMHDAVYVPGQSPASEEMSMHLVPVMYHRVVGTRIPIELCDNVFLYIRWTMPKYHVRHNTMLDPEGPIARLLDLDLAGMSDDWNDFIETQQKIEREFAHLGASDKLKIDAANFLHSFVRKGYVYYTQAFRPDNEKALRNLKALVQAVLVHREFSWGWLAAKNPDVLEQEYGNSNL
jgi:predicted metal-dependent HD superfamily phosphohydrolase